MDGGWWTIDDGRWTADRDLWSIVHHVLSLYIFLPATFYYLLIISIDVIPSMVHRPRSTVHAPEPKSRSTPGDAKDATPGVELVRSIVHGLRSIVSVQKIHAFYNPFFYIIKTKLKVTCYNHKGRNKHHEIRQRKRRRVVWGTS
jgi:hypothetical protein